MFTPPDDRVVGRRVNFMATCLCDSIFSEAAISSVKLLKKYADSVVFPENQTCCGQPAFNSGDFASARKVVLSTIEAFSGNDWPVVVPSASCAAMLYHSAPEAFKGEGSSVLSRVEDFSKRVWELCDYLVNVLGVGGLDGKLPANTRVAIHNSCHSKGSGTPGALRRLVSSIDGVEVVDFKSDSCCGFGGTFSVVFPQISSEMGKAKVEAIMSASPDVVVSADTSCLLHQKGIADKLGIKYPAKHAATLFFEALKNGGNI